MRFKQALIKYFFCIPCVVVLISCNKTLEEERTYKENQTIESYITAKKWKYVEVGGVYHVVRVRSFGYQVAKGDTVTFWYVGYTLKGLVFDTNDKTVAKLNKLDTVNRSFNPLVTVAGKGNLIEGLDDGLLLVNDQEYATIIFPSSLGFGENIIGPVAESTTLAYDIIITKVNGVGIQKEKSYLEKLNPVGYTIDTSGLYYKYSVAGTGITPAATDTIYGWYKGTLPDGTVIDDVGAGNKLITFSDSDVPEGVRLGLWLTKTGGAADLILPSYLGYGNKGKGVVDPYQTLFYQIRLDSIK